MRSRVATMRTAEATLISAAVTLESLSVSSSNPFTETDYITKPRAGTCENIQNWRNELLSGFLERN